MSNEFNIELGVQARESDVDNLQKKINSKVGNIDVGLHISNEWLERIHNKLSNIRVTPEVDTKRAEASILRFKEDMAVKLSNIRLKDISVEDTGALNRLEAEINKVSTETVNADQKMRELKRTFADLSDSISRGKPIAVDISTKTNITELQSAMSRLYEGEVTIKNLNAEVLRGGNVWRTFNGEVRNADGSLRQLKGSVNTTSGEVRVLENELQRSERSTNTLGQSVMRLVGYYLSFHMAVRLVRSAFNNMKEIDTQLTELSKVTDLVRENFKQASLEAVDAGNKWGRTASDFLSASAAFAKAGKDNYKDLAEISVLAQAAGDLSADLANKYLIASDAAFGLGGNTEKLTSLLDSQNQVTNRNAVSMENIAESTRVYANTANIAGESSQTMTALIATGVGATQKSGEEVGRALRTLSMNVRQIKGETEDGLIDEASMAKAEAALRTIGVRTRTIEDGIVSLKQPSAVLDELAQKFQAGEIGAERLAIILEDVGSKRQADILAGMIQNWHLYGKAMSDYTNSAGSAAKEAQKDLESWEGKMNVLSNTWTAFVAKTVDTEWIKGLLDGGTSLLNLFGNLGNAVIVLGGAFALLNANKIANTFNNIFTSFKNVGRLNITRASRILKNVA